MNSVFNIEQLQEVLKDFHEITRIRITVFDDTFQEIVSYPEQRPAFCQIIRSCDNGCLGCALCDQHACQVASSRTSAYIYQCHAGLTEAIMPLYIGNVLAGYLLFGHIFSYTNFEEGWEMIRQCCTAYPVDSEKLKEACKSMPMITQQYIKSAARILDATASHLIRERMAIVQEDSAAAKLDEYISTHYSQPLTAEILCKKLKLGRTRLFKLSQQLYGMGPSEHIRRLRITKARKLLEEQPELRIADVGQQCGFADYNYFIAVFSKETGCSPGAYRKQHSTYVIFP